jgi:hypothetical protein
VSIWTTRQRQRSNFVGAARAGALLANQQGERDLI